MNTWVLNFRGGGSHCAIRGPFWVLTMSWLSKVVEKTLDVQNLASNKYFGLELSIDIQNSLLFMTIFAAGGQRMKLVIIDVPDFFFRGRVKQTP